MKSLGTLDVYIADLSHTPSTGDSTLLIKDCKKQQSVKLKLNRSTAPYLFQRLSAYLQKEEAAVKQLRAELMLP
jgi:hypothetical protein